MADRRGQTGVSRVTFGNSNLNKLIGENGRCYPCVAYLLVQPYVDGARRFHEATVVSAHKTLREAYSEMLRIATELQSHGLAPDVLELYIVDADRRPVRVES